MFLNGTYGTILYKLYDVVMLSNGRLGIIMQVIPSYTVKSQGGIAYTYHAYNIVDYNGKLIDYSQSVYSISPPDKTWKGVLNVPVGLLTDYSFNNQYLPYITSIVNNQDTWKFQWVAIHWVKLMKNLVEHPADNVLKQGKLLSDTDILSYMAEIGITPADIYANKFEDVFFKNQLIKKELNVGHLQPNQYILIIDKGTNKTVLAKTIPIELAEKPLLNTSMIMDLASFGLSFLKVSTSPIISVINGLFGSSKVIYSSPTFFSLLDGTVGYLVYNWKYNRWENNVNVTILTNELGAYFDSNINDIVNTFKIIGRTDAIVTGINKLNSGVPLTPSEIVTIKQPVKDIIKSQQDIITYLKSTTVVIPSGYEAKLSQGIPLTIDEENIIKTALTKRLQEVEQQDLREKQYQDTILATTVTIPKLPTVPIVLAIPSTIVVSSPQQVPQQDLLVYYNQLPKKQQYFILAGAGLVLLFLVL